MVAFVDLRVTDEMLLPLLEAFHPALLPFGKTTLLENTLSLLEQEEIEKITCIISQKPEEIEEYCDKREEATVPIEYWVVSDSYNVGEMIYREEEFLFVEPMTILEKEALQKFLFLSNKASSSFITENESLACIRKGEDIEIVPISFDRITNPATIFELYQKSNNSYFIGKKVTGIKAYPFSNNLLIGDNVSIGKGTHLANTIILPDTIVGKNRFFENKIIAGSWIIDLETSFVTEVTDNSICSEKRERVTPYLIRFLEILISGIALLLLSPLFLIVSLIIKLDSKGPVFYRSTRVTAPTRDEESFFSPSKEVPFTVFRTMYSNADKKITSSELTNKYGSGPYKKFDNDSRITRVGHILRKTSLDELPLLWHVFKGDLSLVGTWALPKYEAEAISKEQLLINNWNLSHISQSRFQSTAGIAGLWQAGGRSSLPADERALLDALQTAIEDKRNYSYSANPRYSLIGYCKAIIDTIYSVLLCRGAQ